MNKSEVQKQINLSMNKPNFQYASTSTYKPYRSPKNIEDQLSTNLNWSIENLLSQMSKVTTKYQTSTNQTVSLTSDQCEFKLDSNSKQNKDQLQESIDLAYSNIKNVLFTLSIDFSNKNANTPKKSSYLQKLQAKLNASTPSSDNPLLKQKQQRIMLNNQKVFIKPTAQQAISPQRRKIRSLFTDSAIKDVASSTIVSKPSQVSNNVKLDIKKINQSLIQKCPLKKSSLSLDQFLIGRCVGSGKFGQVYLCQHRETGFIYALKKIYKSTIKKYNMQSQFLLQIKILYMMNHPNIIKLYTHFSDQYHFFLVMEYVEGGQLLTRLQSNEQYVSQVVKQVIDAIQYIHSLGIVHRDIKPENIVMSFQNTAKLCDFGWAGDFKNKSMKSTYCGTLDYVSPQMKDQGKYTSKVDLWSLGVLTFELLTGNAPFRQQISNWIKKGSRRQIAWNWNITYPKQISEQAKGFIKHLLKQDPDQRAGIRFCKSHYFIIMHKNSKPSISIQLNL